MATFVKIDGWGGLMLLLVVVLAAVVIIYPEMVRHAINGVQIPEVPW